MIARLMLAISGLYALGLATAFFIGANTGLSTPFSAGTQPSVGWLDKVFFLGPVLAVVSYVISGIWAIVGLLTFSIPGAEGAILSAITYLITAYIVIMVIILIRGSDA